MSKRKVYVEGSNWPLGPTQLDVVRAFAKRDPKYTNKPTGAFVEGTYVGLELSELAEFVKGLSRSALRDCVGSLVERGLVSMTVWLGCRATAYVLTPVGRELYDREHGGKKP